MQFDGKDSDAKHICHFHCFSD